MNAHPDFLRATAWSINDPAARVLGRKPFLIGLAAAFLLQAGLLGWMVLDRALLLARGVEIRLAVVPVDPRDLLRGDYVVLSYELSRLRSDRLESADDFASGQPIYVSLRRGGNGWTATSAHATQPQSGVFLKGQVLSSQEDRTTDCSGPCRTYQVAYNLEKFFVPEGKGYDLEQLRNNQRIEVDVAVGNDGRAALKRLLVDGAVRYEDTMF